MILILRITMFVLGFSALTSLLSRLIQKTSTTINFEDKVLIISCSVFGILMVTILLISMVSCKRCPQLMRNKKPYFDMIFCLHYFNITDKIVPCGTCVVPKIYNLCGKILFDFLIGE